jgi:hypothetical protein
MQARIDYLVQYNVAPLDKEKQAMCYVYDPNLNILISQQNYYIWSMNPFDMPVIQDTVTRFTSNIAGKKVLVVGNGIGMLNSLIRDLEPAEHWIIESNKFQRDRMSLAGFETGGTTHIIEDRWEDSTRVEGFPTDFDFIYYNVGYDAFPEDYNGIFGFANQVNKFLNQDGIFTWWGCNNSRMQNNIIVDEADEVPCNIKLILEDHGFSIQDVIIDIDPQIIPETYDVVPKLLFSKDKYLNGYKYQHRWIQKNILTNNE